MSTTRSVRALLKKHTLSPPPSRHRHQHRIRHRLTRTEIHTRHQPPLTTWKHRQAPEGLSNWQLIDDGRAIAVPHRVEFDREMGLWFADIAVRLADAYRPFVRLALARFQPYSLLGRSLSQVVLLDTAQLSPTRTVTVTGNGNRRTVTLSGPAYTEAVTGVSPTSLSGRPVSVSNDDTWPHRVPGPLVQVQVQVRSNSSALFSPDPDLGWEDVPGRLYTLNPDVLLPGVGWRFRVNDVDVSAKPGNSCRLVIREFERDSRKAPFSTDHRQRLAFADSFIVF